MPTAVKGVSPHTADAMSARIASVKPDRILAASLGEDWVTQGDGAGRYGRQLTHSVFYGSSGWGEGYKVDLKVGPHRAEGESETPYYYFHNVKSDDPRVLYMLNPGKRMQGEWNDGSFNRKNYPDDWEGPDLWVVVELPPGMHRVSLYFVNFDGHGGNNRNRDFLVEVKGYREKLEEADLAAGLAPARGLVNFYGGVYKQFLWPGAVNIYQDQSQLQLRLESQRRVHRPAQRPAEKVDKPPVPLNFIEFGPPQVPDKAGDSGAIRAARDIWTSLDGDWKLARRLPLQIPYRLRAYKLAESQDAGKELLDNWRWKLSMWWRRTARNSAARWMRRMTRCCRSILSSRKTMRSVRG